MLDGNLPLNRESYIAMAYLGDTPEEWTAEHEASLPGPLQDFSKVADSEA